jgi:hypothetical protein
MRANLTTLPALRPDAAHHWRRARRVQFPRRLVGRFAFNLHARDEWVGIENQLVCVSSNANTPRVLAPGSPQSCTPTRKEYTSPLSAIPAPVVRCPDPHHLVRIPSGTSKVVVGLPSGRSGSISIEAAHENAQRHRQLSLSR